MSLPSRLDSVLIEDAIKALIKYEKKRESEKTTKVLIENRPKWVLLQVQLKKEISKDSRKPIRVRIPHSYFSTDLEHSICLFLRNDQKEAVETYLESHPIPGLEKIMTIEEVRKYCKEYQQRKLLLSQHDFFLCDHSVGRQLYNLLGKDFGARNHFPVQISFSNVQKLPEAVQQAVDSTYMHLSGRNMTIRMGLTSMSPQEVRENIVEGMEFAVQKLKGGWRDVHSLHLKTKDSASLPIFSAMDNELLDYVRSKAQEKAQEKAAKKGTKLPAASEETPVAPTSAKKKKIRSA
eukprot:gene10003-11066_t